MNMVHVELFYKLVIMLYINWYKSTLDEYMWLKIMYSEDIVQYGSDGSELILVPITFGAEI